MQQALSQLDVKILFDDFTYHANICNKLLQAYAPTYRVQTFLIKCPLNGYIRCNLSAEFQRGLGWSKPFLSLMSKYCLMILLITLTYITLSDL